LCSIVASLVWTWPHTVRFYFCSSVNRLRGSCSEVVKVSRVSAARIGLKLAVPAVDGSSGEVQYVSFLLHSKQSGYRTRDITDK
jgi:hypothetical protein